MKISKEKALDLISSVPLREEDGGTFKGIERYTVGGIDGYDTIVEEWHTLLIKGEEYYLDTVVFREGGH